MRLLIYSNCRTELNFQFQFHYYSYFCVSSHSLEFNVCKIALKRTHEPFQTRRYTYIVASLYNLARIDVQREYLMTPFIFKSAMSSPADDTEVSEHVDILMPICCADVTQHTYTNMSGKRICRQSTTFYVTRQRNITSLVYIITG